MRTTVEFDADTGKAVEQLRHDRGFGVSQAVNELIRRGLVPSREARPFRQRSRSLSLKIDVSNVADALEDLEGPEAH